MIKLLKKAILKIATHMGLFHADEVVGAALWQIFAEGEVVISRLPHQVGEDELSSFDIVMDLGKIHDAEAGRFDHHQYKGGKAAAGLVWDYIKSQNGVHSPRVDELVKLVDENDTGIKKSGSFELPALISNFNSSNPFGEDQAVQFDKAVAFSIEMIKSLLASDALEADAIKVADSTKFTELKGVFEMPRFNRLWSTYLNGGLTPGVEVVIWYDTAQNQWSAQTTPASPGSFVRTGRGIEVQEKLPAGMKFAHMGKFFCCAEDRPSLMAYLSENLK